MERFKQHSKQTLAFWQAHWKGFVGVFLAYCLVEVLFGLLLSEGPENVSWVLTVLNMALFNWYCIAIIFYIDDRSYQKQSSWLSLLVFSFKFIMPVFFLSLLVGLMGTLAMIALIIPGIYVFVKYSFTNFNLLFDNASITDSCRMSWQQTEGHCWLLFSGCALYFVLPALIQVVLVLYAQPAFVDHPVVIFFWERVHFLCWIIYTTFMYQVYQTFIQGLLDKPAEVFIDTPLEIIK